MHVLRFVEGRAALLAACWGLALIAGCGNNFAPFDAGTRSTLNLSLLDLDPAATHLESGQNNLFERADMVTLNGEARAMRGRILGGGDVSIFDLGPVMPGDRIMVEATMAPALNGALAIFDDTLASLLVNDHRNVYLGRVEPFIDLVMRRPSQSCYIAITSTPGYPSTGDYVLYALKEPGAAIPSPRPDVVLLDFAGAFAVSIGSRPAVNVPAFDAGSIDPIYRGRTAEMMAGIVAAVRADFEGLNVTVLSTSEGAVYDGRTTRIFFGAYDAALLGVAESVDEYNADLRQQAIVFTDTFSAFMRLNPTVQQMAQALANVTSHEIGHLLGLVHTEDPGGVMDVTASLRELMRDQSFQMSPLYGSVFPIGWQDGPQYLLDSVGGDAALVLAKSLEAAQRRWEGPQEPDFSPKARGNFVFSRCDLHDH